MKKGKMLLASLAFLFATAFAIASTTAVQGPHFKDSNDPDNCQPGAPPTELECDGNAADCTVSIGAGVIRTYYSDDCVNPLKFR